MLDECKFSTECMLYHLFYLNEFKVLKVINFMSISLKQFNSLPINEAVSILATCCTAQNWAQALAAKRPFDSLTSLMDASDNIWHTMHESDFLQAFEGHPQIGDVSTLSKKYKNTAASAASEQSAVNDADLETLQNLATANQAYLQKFGFIFIIFASGKTAKQMLDLINKRIHNSRQHELVTAANEQNKITRHRLQAMINE